MRAFFEPAPLMSLTGADFRFAVLEDIVENVAAKMARSGDRKGRLRNRAAVRGCARRMEMYAKRKDDINVDEPKRGQRQHCSSSNVQEAKYRMAFYDRDLADRLCVIKVLRSRRRSCGLRLAQNKIRDPCKAHNALSAGRHWHVTMLEQTKSCRLQLQGGCPTVNQPTRACTWGR